MAVKVATPSRSVLMECVGAAVLAPSLHNSQPWRFRVARGKVDVYADRGRKLAVLDPFGREMMISVGAAIFNLRLALRRRGFVSRLDLFPDLGECDLVARISAARFATPTPAVEVLAETISRRHTNRWPFAGPAVAARLLDPLRDAARREGAFLAAAGSQATGTILGLARSADRALRARPGYRTELARWTATGSRKRDGVPVGAMGPRDVLRELPVRHFAEMLPFPTPVVAFEPAPTILVLGTTGDTALDHVRAGQALQRVLLTATSLGLATTPISQPTELAAARERLADMIYGACPQMVLRVGHGRPVAATPRQPLEDRLLPSGGRAASAAPRAARSRRRFTPDPALQAQ
ncbi:nitroreductase family protein [Actinoplanes sp. NPDC048967]|uniref:Acg family FMN-binding oxidoreductase n=1 Tax=Actinoplanes sp. NPDC048967 TaxID=3155269 RepID=UPI0033C01F3B